MADASAAEIAVCFALSSWLLAISFYLGKHAARVDALEKLTLTIETKFLAVFTRLDNLAAAVPHRCILESRLGVIEARFDDIAKWRDQMMKEHQRVLVRLGETDVDAN